MHRAWLRVLFTIGSFVPGIGVFGLAAWLSTTLGRLDPHRPPRIDKETVIAVFLAATLIAFWQIVLGIVVAVHTSGRKDLSSGARAGWTLACLFVGSFALPVFSLVILPGAARAAESR